MAHLSYKPQPHKLEMCMSHTKFFKSKGHEYAFYLSTFTGTQLYSRLGVNWKHYNNQLEVDGLITKVMETIKREASDDVIVEMYASILNDVHCELMGLKKEG